MNVLMLSPGYPSEMPQFARGLSESGAQVIGSGDTPPYELPPAARRALAGYHQIGGFADEDAVLNAAIAIAAPERVERVACLWEPLLVLAARIRERLGLPG